jgi:aspartate 1-decarboxylase
MSMHSIDILLAKVHGIRVTEADLHYTGSLTLDVAIMEAAGMIPYQKVLVVNNNNGERLETYLIKGARDSGVCCLNGAAAHKGKKGDTLILMVFGYMDSYLAKSFLPVRVFINDENKIKKIEKN